jgi:hypothetical protein
MLLDCIFFQKLDADFYPVVMGELMLACLSVLWPLVTTNI